MLVQIQHQALPLGVSCAWTRLTGQDAFKPSTQLGYGRRWLGLGPFKDGRWPLQTTSIKKQGTASKQSRAVNWKVTAGKDWQLLRQEIGFKSRTWDVHGSFNLVGYLPCISRGA